MFEIFHIKSVGIILDMAIKSARDGRSYLQNVKDFLVVNISKIEADDRIYVYSTTGELEMYETIGEVVAAIDQTTHDIIDVPVALKECVYLVGQYDHAHRSIFLFTNRYKADDVRMEEAIQFDKDKQIETQFFVYGIGFGYDRKALEKFCQRYPQVKFRHYVDPADIRQDFTDDFSDLIVVR